MNAVRIELMPCPAAKGWGAVRAELRAAAGQLHELRTASDVAVDALQGAGVSPRVALVAVAAVLADRAESSGVLWRRAATTANGGEARRRNLDWASRHTTAVATLRALAKRSDEFVE